MDELFTNLARRVEHAVGSPWAFLTASAGIIVWLVTGPLFAWSDTWQLVCNTATSVITFLVVFLIQATQTRDTLALHLKINELLRAIEGARTPLALAEELPREELDRLHEEMRDVAQREGEAPPL